MSEFHAQSDGVLALVVLLLVMIALLLLLLLAELFMGALKLSDRAWRHHGSKTSFFTRKS